jgi:hypothetical protein
MPIAAFGRPIKGVTDKRLRSVGNMRQISTASNQFHSAPQLFVTHFGLSNFVNAETICARSFHILPQHHDLEAQIVRDIFVDGHNRLKSIVETR